MQLQEDGKRKSILPTRLLTRKITEEEEEEEDKIKVAELHTVGLNLLVPRSKSRSRLVTHAATHLDFVAVLPSDR